MAKGGMVKKPMRMAKGGSVKKPMKMSKGGLVNRNNPKVIKGPYS